MIAGEIIHEDEESEDSDNDEKFDEEESDDKKKSNEEEFDEEPKDMELSYQIMRLSSEMSLMCSNKMDPHLAVIYFMKMLSTFSWEGKLLMMLAAFSLNFGEFSLVHGHKGLARKLSILRGSETLVVPPHIPEMVTNFIKSILQLTDCIVELAQSSSHNSSPIIPIACYWIFTNLLVYASYFTRLPSTDSKWLIIEETQLYGLTAKIKDIITDCGPILDKKREEDCYKALCYAFSYENPIPSTNNNLDVLKLLFNVKNGGRKKFIYDGHSKELVELHVLKNKSLLLLISPSLDIHKYLILLLGVIQREAHLHVLWIPILDSSTLWDIKHMKEQYNSFVSKSRILSVKNVQKSVAPIFVRFVKEKFFPEFQIGGEPIIVSLDHNGRMVHRNAMHMVLMRALDICERMSIGVDTGDSIIPFLQDVLTETVSMVRDLVPDIDRKMSEVTNKVDGIINDWLGDIEKQMQNPVDSNIFTSKKEKDLWKIDTWCTKFVADLGYVTPMWVEENRCIFLIGGHDIQWVKTFESKVMLANQFNPQSKIEMRYVGSNMKVASKIDEDKDCKVFAGANYSWVFWARLRSIFMSRIKFLEESHGSDDEECDEILGGVKKLLAYEANDLVVNNWAMLCKGNKIVVCDQGEKMLKVMTEYEKWKENAIARGFDQEFKDYHDEIMLHSTSTSLHHHHRCAVKYPCNFESVPEDVKCPECCHGMQKFVTFKCCHGSASDDEAGLDCHDDEDSDYEEDSD